MLRVVVRAVVVREPIHARFERFDHQVFVLCLLAPQVRHECRVFDLPINLVWSVIGNHTLRILLRQLKLVQKRFRFVERESIYGLKLHLGTI